MTYSIPKTFARLQHAASKDTTRYNICGVYFDEKNAVATDGCLMAILPVSSCDQDAKLPTGKIVKFPATLKDKNQINLEVNETGINLSSPADSIELIENAQFPDYNQVIPDESKSDFAVVIDAAKLLRLAQALGELPKKAFVKLHFNSKEPGMAIRVTVSTGKAFGVLMPGKFN